MRARECAAVCSCCRVCLLGSISCVCLFVCLLVLIVRPRLRSAACEHAYRRDDRAELVQPPAPPKTDHSRNGGYPEYSQWVTRPTSAPGLTRPTSAPGLTRPHLLQDSAASAPTAVRRGVSAAAPQLRAQHSQRSVPAQIAGTKLVVAQTAAHFLETECESTAIACTSTA
jgi:hypothetical protein